MSFLLFHTTSVYTDSTAFDWNQEITLRYSARKIAVWPPGRTHSSGYEPKTCIDVSSGHTPINYTSRRNRFNTDHNDLTTTVAASETPDMSGSQQQASSSVVRPWLDADSWSSTRKLVRGCESISNIEWTMSRGKRETEIWKVCKLCPKGEISMSTLNSKLNGLFKETVQLRKDYLRLRQKWTS